MTILIQANEARSRSVANQDFHTTESASTHPARLKQFGKCALAAIVSGLIAAAIIALQTAFYLHSLNY